MEHKDVQAEIVKQCEKCGFSGGAAFPHCVKHRPKFRSDYRKEDDGAEAMVFICNRCGYEWEIVI